VRVPWSCSLSWLCPLRLLEWVPLLVKWGVPISFCKGEAARCHKIERFVESDSD